MPDRSYYVDTASAMAAIRGKYRQHVAAMLGLAGIPDGEQKAAAIVQLETRIATRTGPAKLRATSARATTTGLGADFSTKAPGLDWEAYFAAAGLRPPGFVVWQPSAVTGISALTASEPLDDLEGLPHLPRDRSRTRRRASLRLQRQTFAFFGPVLSGAQKPRDRWKRAVTATNGRRAMPWENVRRSDTSRRRKRRGPREWSPTSLRPSVTGSTARLDGTGYQEGGKSQARRAQGGRRLSRQLAQTTPGCEIARETPTATRARPLYQYRQAIHRLSQPVDRGEWVMTPQTVNAVNLPAMNALNFPAAILQPPFFDPKRPLAMDYGAIGSVIGHEVSHSFDNQGALFDARGRLHNWWTPEDFKHFEASSAQLVAQYDSYRPFPDLAVKGQQTLGENIADVAGLAAAYDAFHRSLGGKPAPEVDGFTGDQQFFISFAQSWRGKAREPSVRNQILTDGHSPARTGPQRCGTSTPGIRPST